MDCNYYKNCIVPQCASTTVKTPKKLFIHVPKSEQVRKKWLELARRDTNVSSVSRMYFCEDHFDLPNDMENYTEYHIMGTVSRICMKPGCYPTKFDCQPDRRKRTCRSSERQDILKKQRMKIIEECLNQSVERSTESTSETKPVVPEIEENLQTPKTANKSVQALITHKYRSKATQTRIKLVDRTTSPLRTSETSISRRPSGSGINKTSKKLLTDENQSKSDISSPSTQSLPNKSDHSEYIINRIMNKPQFYIGLPKSCDFLIDLLTKETNIPLNHLLLCFKKIRLDTEFEELADQFAMTSSSCVSEIFLKNIPVIASVMRPFIVKLDTEKIKRTLPIAFRHKYYNISCIINCFEVEIEKPSEDLHQILTWSDNKRANTTKYLISCTPNGLVNFISPGFGGSITDTSLLETCNFVECLKKGMNVMVDKGFKHAEQFFLRSGVQLIRLPSVQIGVKLNKNEAMENKQIARLKVHVEKVIRRLNEFSMLKPHEFVNTNFIQVLDDIITIACGLINLQGS